MTTRGDNTSNIMKQITAGNAKACQSQSMSAKFAVQGPVNKLAAHQYPEQSFGEKQYNISSLLTWLQCHRNRLYAVIMSPKLDLLFKIFFYIFPYILTLQLF